jgi:hypothetical protein
MILDKKLLGVLDQGAGTLLIFDEPTADVRLSLVPRSLSLLVVPLFTSWLVCEQRTYPAALETVQGMNKVVDSLFEKWAKVGADFV